MCRKHCTYRLVVGQIDDLLIYCKYGLVKESDRYVPDPTGCQQQIQLGKVHDIQILQHILSRKVSFR